MVAVLPTRQLGAPRAGVPANPQTPPSRGSCEIAEHRSHRTAAVEAGAGPPRFRGRRGAPHLSVSKDLAAVQNLLVGGPAHAQGPSLLLGGQGKGQQEEGLTHPFLSPEGRTGHALCSSFSPGCCGNSWVDQLLLGVLGQAYVTNTVSSQ